MKILFVSAILPYPLHSGGQVRLYNLLKRLSLEHEITLYTYIRKEDEKKYIQALSFLKAIHVYFRGFVWQPKYVVKSLSSDLPLLMASYDHEEMKHDIALDLKHHEYDVVHCEPFYVHSVLPNELPCPLVIAEHNIEYTVYDTYVDQFPIPLIRPFLRYDVKKMKDKEKASWKQAKKVIAVSQKDLSVVDENIKEKKARIVPNGVDIENFRFKHKSTVTKPEILFVGNFLWMPNVKAVEQLVYHIWPHIKKTIPSAILTIVGKHLSNTLENDAKRRGIVYKPFVEDIKKEYQKADILLAPMTIAGGTKFKMLEAMASGCLVITTKEGMEGIEAKKDVHYLEVQTALDAVSAIQSVMENSKKFNNITEKARSLIESTYDWKQIANTQSKLWKQMV
jgi:glycosyltransferase involved in cell wall biosynthesis